MPPVSNPLVPRFHQDAERLIESGLSVGHLGKPLFVFPLRLLKHVCQPFHDSHQRLQPCVQTVHAFFQIHVPLLNG